ncbi:hypothetical protein PTSG_06505 [Salpingoeca rosetta]|uniref:PX domain-containing protein n=1 Tax=Salpingoeca rosetta (strain ATCC 50818 / BSB-021) TaxID=946362 RepID=F2UG02_SALR5|nr:uncharacterized protein PTSG_06505 [Salpingoeca rosetta]EGD75430.1 hypothetical protein PTSG_06505 [Salpingoeca rosetta]|eukprot:XP_004991887.1 hypothetical protein PTSG_06505 [Salpingoeca rosetta]
MKEEDDEPDVEDVHDSDVPAVSSSSQMDSNEPEDPLASSSQSATLTAPVPDTSTASTTTGTHHHHHQQQQQQGDDVGAAPSASSSSALPQSATKLRFQETNLEDFTIDIKFPLKHGEGRRAYASYTIETKVTRDGPFKASEMSVQRRYSHFAWLRTQLARCVPGRIVPPVPPKHDLTMNKFSEQFLETRRAGLERFLRRVAAHSVLSHNPAFVAFLELKTHEFETYMKDHASEYSRDSLASSIQSLGTSLAERDPTSRYVRERELQQQTEKATRRMAELSTKIVAAHRDESSLQQEVAVAFRALAESDTDISVSCETIADGLEKVSAESEEHLRAVDRDFAQPVQDFALYPHAVMDALHWRDVQEARRQRLETTLANKEDELSKLQTSDQKTSLGAIFGKDPEAIKREKIEKTTQQVQELTEAVDSACDKEAVANETLNSDLDRHHEVQEHELRRVIAAWAEHEAERYTQIEDAWAGVEASLTQQIELQERKLNAKEV